MINGAKANDQYYSTLVDILSSLKEIVIFLRQKNNYIKKFLNLQISAFFFFSFLFDFIQMYFDIGDLFVKMLKPF